MTSFNLKEHPHRRFNPLTREWVLVSPHRAKRPWLGQVENLPREKQPRYDPSCYMCPGNPRASGARNPSYQHTLVFDNDYPALLTNSPAGKVNTQDLIVASPESGILPGAVLFPPARLGGLANGNEGLKAGGGCLDRRT